MITNTSAPQVVDPSPSSLKITRLEKSAKGDSNFDHAPINKYLWCLRWCTPKLLNGFKCESKLKTTEEQGVGACSLAHSTLWGGRGACWNSGIGLVRVTSINYSCGFSNGINNSSSHWVLTLAIALWTFGSPSELQLPKWKLLWECEGSFPHTFV